MFTYTVPLKSETSALRMADNCRGSPDSLSAADPAALVLGSSAAAVEGPAPAVAASAVASLAAVAAQQSSHVTLGTEATGAKCSWLVDRWIDRLIDCLID